VHAEPSGVIEFRVLGSLEAVDEGQPLALGAPPGDGSVGAGAVW
jgi:uncharacterized protein (DUF342 family)